VYLEYFGLAERPFSIAPDPHYLYMSARHKEAMAHLTYGLSQGGCFIVLTGEVGTGKTTLCRNLLRNLPTDVEVALILNANINEQELLQSVCDELKIGYQESDSQKKLLDNINAHLLSEFAENRQTVLIIDEAQLLSRDVLEQIRLLTNLETTKSKLLQIILIGQPELNDVLSRNDLRQLAQRVTARYHLGALARSDIEDYVSFRLSVAGCRKPLFTKQALAQLHRATGGIPRRINVLADHALLSAYAKTEALVDAKNIKATAKEVFIRGSDAADIKRVTAKWAVALFALLLVNALLWWWFVGHSSMETALDAPRAVVAQESVDDLISEIDATHNARPPVTSGRNGVTTILRSADIVPGSVVIADQPLDESELRTELSTPITQSPRRVYHYDASSELGKALDTSADLTGRIMAFRALAAAWDVDLPKKLIQPACEILQSKGVECLGVSSWAQLQRFNRPTILVLDQNKMLHRVIVFKLENDVAQVLVGQNVLNVGLDELKSRWTNNGITFWRPSAAGHKFLQQGDADALLPDVRRLLSNAFSELGLPVLDDLDSTTFGQPLSQSVFALQSRYALVADRKIGNETYLLMNEVLVPEETPVLRQRVQ
jgi:general secretion pathway protein A